MKSENEDKKQLRVERTCIKSNIEIRRMYYLYSLIRGTQPPDIFEFIIENNEVFNAIRKNKYKLTRTQSDQLNKLLKSFAGENLVYMEEIDNG